MKGKKKLATILVVSLLGVALLTVPAMAVRGRAAGRGAPGMGMGMGPAFTEEQQEQVEKIHEKYADNRAELTNRLKVLALEADDAVGDGEPDYNAIENRIEEMSKIRVELAKLRLRIHKEIRPLLDDDQKILFDRGLGRGMMGGRGGHPGMMGHRGMSGGMKGGRGGRPGMMGQSGMGGGMMGGPGAGRGMMGGQVQMYPWCPFADDVEDDD